ncbi:MAG: DsbA family protein [Pseudomonadota bacterium]
MNRWIGILAALAVVAVGGWFAFGSVGEGTPGATSINPIGAANAQENGEDIDTSGIVEMQIGNPDAPVTMIEYASYTCPHCANFHNGQFKQLKKEYIDTGKINFIYREVYFDRYGLWASALARCAGPDKFFGMTDMIYADQQSWSRAGDPAAIVEELRKIGRLAGLESDQIEACMQDGDKMRSLVAWYQENAEADGISSTPSFVINGNLHSNMGYNQMKDILDAAGS